MLSSRSQFVTLKDQSEKNSGSQSVILKNYAVEIVFYASGNNLFMDRSCMRDIKSADVVAPIKASAMSH
jgi:hypothetical protein